MSRGLFKKVKIHTPYPVPRPPHPPTTRDLLRAAYRSADSLDLLKKLRNTPTRLQRLLDKMHLPRTLADTLTHKEALELFAALSDLPQGKTSGTLPERLVGAWLMTNGFEYGGMGPIADISKDWTFQVPLEGGRSRLSGGAVADFFLSARMTNTDMGVVLREQGIYWHSKADVVVRDAEQKRRLEADGYKVADLWDFEAENLGVLDTRMRSILAGSYE